MPQTRKAKPQPVATKGGNRSKAKPQPTKRQRRASVGANRQAAGRTRPREGAKRRKYNDDDDDDDDGGGGMAPASPSLS
jgi:hypothetical protein